MKFLSFLNTETYRLSHSKIHKGIIRTLIIIFTLFLLFYALFNFNYINESWYRLRRMKNDGFVINNKHPSNHFNSDIYFAGAFGRGGTSHLICLGIESISHIDDNYTIYTNMDHNQLCEILDSSEFKYCVNGYINGARTDFIISIAKYLFITVLEAILTIIIIFIIYMVVHWVKHGFDQDNVEKH